MRFSQIDDLTRSEHSYVSSSDCCIYLREYTAGKGYSHSETNQLIYNLKKTPDRRGRPEYTWKERALQQCAREISDGLNPDWLKTATLVPIPPSKVKGDPAHDDRILQVLEQIVRLRYGSIRVDVRELVLQRANRPASHESAVRLKPYEHKANYIINEPLATPLPVSIGLFDDVLTSGSQFKAAQSLLQDRFGAIPIVGVFVARRELGSTISEDDEGPDYDFEDFEDD